MDSLERRRTPVRVALAYLAITGGYLAVWILLAPASFYESFPTGPAEWVSPLPPYNEHLLRDFGATSLGLAVLAALAAVWMDRRVIQAAALAHIVAGLPHLAYHLTTTERYSTADNVQSLIGLAAPIALGAALLAATRRPAAVGA